MHCVDFYIATIESTHQVAVSPSITLKLDKGDRVQIVINDGGTIRGDGGTRMYTWLNIIPLYML